MKNPLLFLALFLLCFGFSANAQNWNVFNHNYRYNYKYDYTNSEYNGCTKHIIITCLVHGDFKQIAAKLPFARLRHLRKGRQREKQYRGGN